MAVVINEFEVTPAPAPKAPAAGKQSQESSTVTPRLLRDLEKASQARARHEHRLKAY